jgi:fimbrial chaperone protein
MTHRLFMHLPALLVGVFLMSAAPASAEMLISPTRVLLDDNRKTATLTLRNTSGGPRTYRLQWEEKRANAQGGYVAVESGESWPAASAMVRLSPRQVTVGPGENQTVRLSWRPPANLAPGEYRSHLLLKVISDVSEPTGVVEPKSATEGIGIQLFMQMSFSIPVVVRHGTEPPRVTLRDVQVLPAKQKQGTSLALTLERAGAASSFGRLVVEMQKNAASPVELIGEYREFSIFHEVDRRVVRLPLRNTQIPAGAWIRVAYEGRHEYDGVLWAEQIFRSE